MSQSTSIIFLSTTNLMTLCVIGLRNLYRDCEKIESIVKQIRRK
jgi:hypothetical protein